MMLCCRPKALVQVAVGLLLCCWSSFVVRCDHAEPLAVPPVPTTPSPEDYIPPDEWDFTVHDYPNPWSQYKKCKQPAESWLCDPNKRLEDEERVNLTKTLQSYINQPKPRSDNCLMLGVAVVQKIKVLNAIELAGDMRRHGADILSAWLTSANHSCGALLFISTTDERAEFIVKNDTKSQLKSEENLQIGAQGLFAFTYSKIVKYAGKESVWKPEAIYVPVSVVVAVVAICAALIIIYLRAKRAKPAKQAMNEAKLNETKSSET